jgi:hypothetical protein
MDADMLDQESAVVDPQDLVPEKSDDNDPLVGLRSFAEFATGEGFPISTSTMQKYCSPAWAKGPQVVGYWGILPMSTKGLVRSWIRARMTRVRPVNSAKKLNPSSTVGISTVASEAA